MAKRDDRKPRERVIAEQLAYGNLLAASPGVRALAETTKRELAEGLTEEQARQRIRSRLESEGLTLRKQMLPSLSRRLTRVPLRKLLHALADHIADRSQSRTFGKALDSLVEKVGLDQWMEDYIYAYAASGRVLPMFSGYTGTVVRMDMGMPADKTPTVWLIATPASDTEALIEWFREEARDAFPDETFAKRHGKALEGAQFYRMKHEGRTYAQIAHDNVYELYPDLCASDDDEEFAFYTKLVERETERVKKLAERTAQRGDKIALYMSPEDSS